MNTCDRVERRNVQRSSIHGELADAAVSSGTMERSALQTAIARSASRIPTWTWIPNVLFRQATYLSWPSTIR